MGHDTEVLERERGFGGRVNEVGVGSGRVIADRLRMRLHRIPFRGTSVATAGVPPEWDARAAVAIGIVSGSLLCMALAACRTGGNASTHDADTLAQWMSGSFSSRAQHAAEVGGDADELRALVARHGDHADVRMHAVPVWTERTDGRWLYVERERGNQAAKPESMRVVHIHVEDGELASDTYLLPGDEARFAGAWKSNAPLQGIGPDALTLREGCTLHWSRADGGTFVGASEPGACRSDLNGAAYAVSRMTVSSARITSWDRGFDASDRQVWGVTSGPYAFEREVVQR